MIQLDSIHFQSWFIVLSIPQVAIVTANTPCIDNASSKLRYFRYFKEIAAAVVVSIQQNTDLCAPLKALSDINLRYFVEV
jgi:hypothetical protein